MSPRRRPRALLAALALLLTGLATVPATADTPAITTPLRPFTAPVTISDPRCDFDQQHVQTAADTTGRVRGFATLWGSDCNPNLDITYIAALTSDNSTWVRRSTGLRGFPVAAAVDTTGTYLLYVSYPGLNLRLVKRTNDGTVSAGRTLSTHVASDGSLAQGALVARNGRYWAVWREHVRADGTPGDEFDQTDLFEANTFTGAPARTRLTTSARWDGAPSLAFTSGTAFPLTLTWTNGGSDYGDGGAQTDLKTGTRTATGSWHTRVLTAAGYHNFWPEVKVSTAATYVVWNQDGATVLGTVKAGVLSTKEFVVGGAQSVRPRLAVDSGSGSIAVAWTTGTGRVIAADRSLGVWTSRYASPATPVTQLLTGLSTRNGRPTVVIASQRHRLYSVSESG